MTKRTIILDLDETLLDTSQRHYRVYCDIVNILNLDSKFDQNEFWNLKREGKSTIEILDEKENEILKKFSKLWIDKIEQKKYLFHDKLYDNTLKLLSDLNNERLILLTMRHNRKNLIWELKNFGLDKYFTSILSCSPIYNKDKSSVLLEYLKDNKLILDNNSIIIGDSEIDINTGKTLNLTTIAVSYGIRSENLLIAMNPDFCLKNIDEITDIINEIDHELMNKSKKLNIKQI
jgi:phosphoglycolate phosphatase